MRYRLSIPVACAAFLVVLSVAPRIASAQSRLDIFVTPIPDAPFSGVVNVQRTFVQPNGPVQALKTVREIGRDRQGRIYSESRTLEPLSFTGTPELISTHLYDPQSRISTMLDAGTKTFRSMTVNRPPPTQPPALIDASPSGTNLPQSQFAQREDLGVHEIDGLSAHGVRVTQTIPDSNGTGNVKVVDEYWYSEDLRINLIIRHNDPRTGTISMTVTNITRTDPDPARFQIPEDYKQPAPGCCSPRPNATGNR